MALTELQKKIVEEDRNTVVLAAPGSGKTKVMSKRIQRVLSNNTLKDYQGIIALSFTKKASCNLRDKTLVDGINKRMSYFGTIDSFCWSEIIEPYGNFVFGHPTNELDVVELKNQNTKVRNYFKWIEVHQKYSAISVDQWDSVKRVFLLGRIFLESFGLLAYYILLHCNACNKFIRSRYKQIYIDEFQDADEYTYLIFRHIVNLGAVGVAVGDVNQSIFGFAHKSSKYLKELFNDSNYIHFPLYKNFRCHPSIINYSNRLLNPNSPMLEVDENRVFLFTINGNEVNVASFLDEFIPRVCKNYNVKDYSKVGILVRNSTTAEIIKNHIKFPCRFIESTPLDKDTNTRSDLYSDLLRFCLDKKLVFRDIVSNYIDYDNLTRTETRTLATLKGVIREYFIDETELDITHIVKDFRFIADIVIPTMPEKKSTELLTYVLNNKELLHSYLPLNPDEVTIMTLHKSKGLEFDVVFHLNLHEWIIPMLKPVNGVNMYIDYYQDLYLHYVGITRAKKTCIMVVSTQRTNKNGKTLKGSPSEFLNLNNVNMLRQDFTW